MCFFYVAIRTHQRVQICVFFISHLGQIPRDKFQFYLFRVGVCFLIKVFQHTYKMRFFKHLPWRLSQIIRISKHY